MMLKHFRMFAGLLLASATVLSAVAADPIKEREVELFAAMEAGEIETELIAPSPRQIFLRVDNKTTEMLRIRLPKSFAAVPVLAQMQPGIFPGGGLQGGQLGLGQLTQAWDLDRISGIKVAALKASAVVSTVAKARPIRQSNWRRQSIW